MGVYHEIYLVYSGGSSTYEIELYRQPMIRHVTAAIYHGWESLTWRVLRILEPSLRRRHRKRCDDACKNAWFTKPGEDAPTPMCSYMPVTARQDLRCYDLKHREREQLYRHEISHVIAQALGWKWDEIDLAPRSSRDDTDSP